MIYLTTIDANVILGVQAPQAGHKLRLALILLIHRRH